MVREISIVGLTRLSNKVLKQSTLAAHPAIAPGTDMRCLSRPSRPTIRLNRSTSRESWSSYEMAWLKAAAICSSIPSQSEGNRTEKLPSRNSSIDASICLDRDSAGPSPLEGGIIVSVMVPPGYELLRRAYI